MPPSLKIRKLEDGRRALDIDSFYEPLPHVDLLHRSLAKNLLAIGGAGSGKSFFLLGEAIYTACDHPGSNVLLLRRDFPELEKGLILDFKNIVPDVKFEDGRRLYEYNDTKHIATWWNGSKTFFGHLNSGNEKDLSQYLSSAFVFIGVDELGQFSYSAWAYLSWRNRVNSGCLANGDGRMPYCRMAGATNPLGPGYGWIKSLWIDLKPVSQMGEVERSKDGKYFQMQKGVPTCVYDPKDYFYVHSTVLNNPFMMEKDPAYLDKLQKLPPALRAKALEGDLNSVSGAYFQNFEYSRNVRSLPRDHDEIRFEHWQPRWLSFDWGLAHYSAVYWHARVKVKDIDGSWKDRVLTYRELLVNEMSWQAVTDRIAELTPRDERELIKFCFLSPERFNRQHDTQHTIADEISARFKGHGLPSCSRANDRREDGATFMYNLINSGEWIILDSCSALIASIETRVRDEKHLEDVLKSEDELDDAYDSARYGLLSMLKERGKPEDVKLAEKLATIPDHTSRMIYAYSHRLKERGRSEPIAKKVQLPWQVRRR